MRDELNDHEVFGTLTETQCADRAMGLGVQSDLSDSALGYHPLAPQATMTPMVALLALGAHGHWTLAKTGTTIGGWLGQILLKKSDMNCGFR